MEKFYSSYVLLVDFVLSMVELGQIIYLGLSLIIFSPRGSIASVVDYTISSVEFMEYIKYFSVGNITTYSDHCLMSIDLALNSESQASLHKLYLQSLDLVENEIIQDSETYLEAEAYSFTSQATSFDLQKVYAKSSFIMKFLS